MHVYTDTGMDMDVDKVTTKNYDIHMYLLTGKHKKVDRKQCLVLKDK